MTQMIRPVPQATGSHVLTYLDLVAVPIGSSSLPLQSGVECVQ